MFNEIWGNGQSNAYFVKRMLHWWKNIRHSFPIVAKWRFNTALFCNKRISWHIFVTLTSIKFDIMKKKWFYLPHNMKKKKKKHGIKFHKSVIEITFIWKVLKWGDHIYYYKFCAKISITQILIYIFVYVILTFKKFPLNQSKSLLLLLGSYH